MTPAEYEAFQRALIYHSLDSDRVDAAVMRWQMRYGAARRVREQIEDAWRYLGECPSVGAIL